MKLKIKGMSKHTKEHFHALYTVLVLRRLPANHKFKYVGSFSPDNAS